jgi:hypothetical protein
MESGLTINNMEKVYVLQMRVNKEVEYGIKDKELNGWDKLSS